MAEIKVEGLRHVYSAGTPFEKVAIEDVSLTIPQGQLVGVIGHTGSGKSTFIQHLNALLQPTEGKSLSADRTSMQANTPGATSNGRSGWSFSIRSISSLRRRSTGISPLVRET